MGVRFRPAASLLGNENSLFRAQLFPAGFSFKDAVRIFVIGEGGAEPVRDLNPPVAAAFRRKCRSAVASRAGQGGGVERIAPTGRFPADAMGDAPGEAGGCDDRRHPRPRRGLA